MADDVEDDEDVDTFEDVEDLEDADEESFEDDEQLEGVGDGVFLIGCSGQGRYPFLV